MLHFILHTLVGQLRGISFILAFITTVVKLAIYYRGPILDGEDNVFYMLFKFNITLANYWVAWALLAFSIATIVKVCILVW